MDTDYKTLRVMRATIAERDARIAKLEADLGALVNDGCIDASACVYAIPGLTDYEADRINGREGWDAALNRVAARCRAALAKSGSL